MGIRRRIRLGVPMGDAMSEPLPILEYEGRDCFTIGKWATEDESAAALDSILAWTSLWTVYREVCGALAHPRPMQLNKAVRIDRVLVPKSRLIDLGWVHGAIGIEVKRSGVKIGPPIAQAMDYSRAIWTLPSSAGIKVWLDWVFVWPMQRQIGTVASILAQNRIGCAYGSVYAPLHLKSGEQSVIRIRSNGDVDIGDASNGRRVGSR